MIDFNNETMIKDKNIREATSLRNKAEKKLIKKKSVKTAAGSEADNLKLIHELEVHQIELKMQFEELQLAEARAESVLEKFTSLYDFAPVGYFTLDTDCRICELNLGGARILGKERSLLLKSKFRQFVTNDTLPVFNDFLRDIFRTNSRQTCEVRLKTNEVNTILIHVEGIISEDELKCLITAVDITEREIAEGKLQSSETHYRRLFESARDGILILDAFSGQIVDVNPFLIELLGYTYEEFLGKELWEIGIFKNIDDSKTAFIELQNKGYIRFEDMPLETKNGKPINVEYVSNVYLVDRSKVIQCNIRDMTDHKRYEEALIKSETSLRELNAAKDKFFSIIAHDLKSPLSSIIGLSELLTEKMSRKDYDGIEEYATIIQNSSWRVMDLITNLIEWAQLQTGRMEFKPEPVEIVSLVNKVTELSNDAARQKSISIFRELPSYFKVLVDKHMISTVLRNLLSNAIKFTKPGGKIIISAVQKENELLVAVSDNGIGIKKDALDKLFLLESSSSTPGTMNEEGTGLGLILCKDFVLKNGGMIWAESEANRGSRFVFTLPV